MWAVTHDLHSSEEPMMKSLVAVCAVLASSLGAAAQTGSADSLAALSTQPSTNVFRRFTTDLAKMKEFYGDVLGLKALPTLNMPGGGQMTRYQVGTSEIKLLGVASGSGGKSGNPREVIGLRVLTFFFPDEGALAARFKAHGYQAPEFRKAAGTASGTSVATVQDPDGQWVELVVAPGAPAATFDRVDLGLTVSDIEKSRAFYGQFVGLEELPAVDDVSLGTKTYRYRLGTTTINLRTFGAALPVDSYSSGIQYVVRDVEAVDVRAKARDVRITQPLGNFSAALRTIWLADPDGITNYFAQVDRRTETTDASSR
jgi:catechol 2,3-dioxygenase-like lactoylglutathione lyase family enzyme